MKRIFFIAIITLLQFQSIGQENKSLIGKWKIVTFDAVVFHDYRNDSTYFPPEFLETLKGSKDSTFMVGFLDGMIKGFNNYYYEFKERSEYKEIKNDKIKAQGTYDIFIKDKKIVLNSKDKFGGETKQTLLYELTDKILLLKIPSDEMDLKIELVRVE